MRHWKSGGRPLDTILIQLAIYLAAAVVAVPLSQRLGFGSVLGYLAAGVAIGPALGLVGTESEDIQHYAEYGVVLMLFLIGLEMRPRVLWDMRHRLVGLGGLQVAVTIVLLAGIARVIGLPWNQAVAIGITLSLSSTAIVMQTLAEKKLVATEGGRASLAVLLFQDAAAIPLLALMPLLALGALPAEEALKGAEAIEDVSPWGRAALVVGAVALVILAGRYLTRPVYRFLSWAHLPEIQVAGALLAMVGVSLTMTLLGLSPALGSFLAGVVLASSPYRHQLEADLAPFKGLLLGLFFMTVGAGMDLGYLAARPLPVLGYTLLFLTLKMLVLWPLARLFGLPPQARLLFTLGLAQAGEFGFFLLAFAEASRVLHPEQAEVLLLVIALSMAATPALFRLHGLLTGYLGQRAERGPDEIDEEGPVIIAGMGRFGQVVNRIVTGLGHRTVVIDSHPETVERMRGRGIKAFYGEVDRPELMTAAGIGQASAVVLAIDDPEKVVEMTEWIHRHHPGVKVIARARDRHHVYELRAAGASDTVREVFDSAVEAAGSALGALGYGEAEIGEVLREFGEHDRTMLAELGALWSPGVPVAQNEAFLRKEREQSEAIAAAMRGRAERRAAAESDVAPEPDALRQ